MATQQKALVITTAGHLPEFQEVPVPQLQKSQLGHNTLQNRTVSHA